MRARSALFDIYGDLLPQRDHQATVAGLVRLLEPVGIAQPAVRTAISRMVAQGWLEPVEVRGQGGGTGRGYRATPRAIERLREASVRVYRQRQSWSGHWQLLFAKLPTHRTARAQLRRELEYLGFGQLSEGVWVSPQVNTEAAEVLRRAGLPYRCAETSRLSPADWPLSAWDLDVLRQSYVDWLEHAQGAVRREWGDDPDRDAFADRFELVHSWRKFLFTDPGLPATLLPEDWPRSTAESFFAEQAQRLRPAAERFVARVLDPAPGAEPGWAVGQT